MTLRNLFKRKWLSAWLMAAGAVAMMNGPAQAGLFDSGCGCGSDACASTCDTGCGCDSGSCLDGTCFDGELGEPVTLMSLFHDDPCNEPSFTVGGWTQWGYYSETNGMFFDNDAKGFRNHQSWLYAERVADGSEGFDWGFRADIMYGQDADDTQAFGNPAGSWDYLNGWDRGAGYGWAMPQLYGEVAMGDLSVKAGHFYTLLGYEVVTAPDNFFFSHSYTMFNSEAFTHTGVLATYNASDNLTLYGGWTLGWDTGFDQLNKGSNFLGGASVGVTDELTVTYITTVGNLGFQEEGYTHSVVADFAVTDDLNYIVQSDYFDNNAGYDTVGLNQFLIYSVSEKLGVGGRMEWWKADGVSHYALTGGVNIRPMANLVIRPEVRHDWAPGGNLIQPQGNDDYTTFAVDTILTF